MLLFLSIAVPLVTEIHGHRQQIISDAMGSWEYNINRDLYGDKLFRSWPEIFLLNQVV